MPRRRSAMHTVLVDADAVAAVGTERARVSVTSPTSPVLIEPVDGDDYTHIVMPMVTPQ